MSQCPRCHALARARDQYCGHCGQRLALPARSAELAQTQRALRLADVHYKLGLVYARRGQSRLALEAWERALAEVEEGDPLRQEVEAARRELRSREARACGGGANPPLSPPGDGP